MKVNWAHTKQELSALSKTFRIVLTIALALSMLSIPVSLAHAEGTTNGLTGISSQAELQAAINDVTADGVVTLTQNIEISGEPITIPNKTFTINGSGYDLTLGEGYNGFHMKTVELDWSTVTFNNLNFLGHNTDEVTAENYSQRAVGGGLVAYGDYMMVKGDNYYTPSGNLNFNNCTFIGNHQIKYSLNGYTKGYGGALEIKNIITTVNNSTFTNNSSTDGGAIAYSGPLYVNNSIFSGNYATTYGGALVAALGANEASRAVVTGSRFINNKAAYGGVFSGGKASGSNSFYGTDSLFKENQATVDGGVLWNYSDGQYTVTRCDFINNYAKKQGGVMKAMGLISVDCNYEGNEAEGSGGAIYHYIGPSKPLQISGGSFTNNSSGANGGAISTNFINFNPTDAASTERPPFVVIDGTKFSGNKAAIGYAYIDFENALTPKIFAASMASDYYQNLIKEYYNKNITNVNTWSAAPTKLGESQHIYNNYDIATFRNYILVLSPTDAEVTWSDGGAWSGTSVYQRQFVSYGSVTLDELFNANNAHVQRDGYVLAGWRNNQSSVQGYSAEKELWLDKDYYLRGTIVIQPVWAELFDVTFEPNGGNDVDPKEKQLMSPSNRQKKTISLLHGTQMKTLQQDGIFPKM